MRWIGLLFVIWAALFIWSFASFAILEPTGDSFTRGLNRVGTFVGSQFGAGFVAFAIAILGRKVARSPAQQWIIRLPLIMAALFALVLISIILFATFGPEQVVTIPMEQKATAPVRP